MTAPADFTHVPTPLAASRWPQLPVVLTQEEADVVRTAIAGALGALGVLDHGSKVAAEVSVKLETALAIVHGVQYCTARCAS